MYIFLLAPVIGAVEYTFGSHYGLFAFYLLLNIFDLLSGVVASFLRVNYDGKKLVFGLVKKLGYWLLVATAFAVCSIFANLGNRMGVDLGITEILGWMVLASLLLQEVRSILDNLSKAGVRIPESLKKALALVEHEFDEMADGSLILNTTDPNVDSVRLQFNGSFEDLLGKDSITLKIVNEDK